MFSEVTETHRKSYSWTTDRYFPKPKKRSGTNKPFADLHCMFDTSNTYCLSHLNQNLLNNSNHHHRLLRLILSLPSLARTRAPRCFCCTFFVLGGGFSETDGQAVSLDSLAAHYFNLFLDTNARMFRWYAEAAGRHFSLPKSRRYTVRESVCDDEGHVTRTFGA